MEISRDKREEECVTRGSVPGNSLCTAFFLFLSDFFSFKDLTLYHKVCKGHFHSLFHLIINTIL